MRPSAEAEIESAGGPFGFPAHVETIRFECPPLGEGSRPLREWTFDERYPELAYLRRKGAREMRAVEAYYERIVEFTEEHVAPRALDIDRALFEDPTHFPAELARAACSYHLFSAPFPRAYGGQGLHPLAVTIALEVIASSCVGVANLLGVSGLAISALLSTMDLRKIRSIAEKVCEAEKRGEPTFLSTCVTEPGSGSDSEDREELARARLCTVARPVAGGYRLNGTKVFISNGSLAETHVVVAVGDLADPVATTMVLVVPANLPGVSVARIERKMGQKVCPAAEISFDDVFVPEEFRCRPSDAAWKGIANVLGMTRSGVGAFAAGVAEGAYRIASEHARRSTLLDIPLERQQWMQVALGHMARRAQIARTCTVASLLATCEGGLYRVVDDLTKGFDPPYAVARLPVFRRIAESERSMRRAERALARQSEAHLDTAASFGDVTKVSTTDLAVENCHEALSLLGKDGMRHEEGAEKLRAGITNENTGDHEGAERAFRRGLELDPDNVELHNALGWTLFQNGRPAEAAAEYRKALANEPNHVKSHNNLALALVELGRLDEAATHYRRALELEPKAEIHSDLGFILARLGRPDEALAHYRQALELDPQCASAHFNLAVTRVMARQYGDAESHYRAALETKPNAETYNGLGYALARQGRLDEAVAQFRKAIETDPEYTPAFNNLADTLEKQGELEEAEVYDRRSLDEKPNAAVSSDLGSVLVKLDKVDDAAEQFQNALDMEPENAAAKRGLAAIERERRSTSE